MVCNSSFSPSELLSTDEIWSNHSSSIYCSNVHSNFQYAGGEALQGQHRANNQYSLQVKFEMLGRDSIWSWFLSSNDGQSIITSSADDQIIIYDCEKGTQKRVLNSKKYWETSILFIQSITSTPNRYGVDLIHFTQNKGHAVHASTKENDIIRSEKNTLFPNGDDKTEDWNEGTLCSGTCPWRKTSTSATLADTTRELSPWLWIPLMRLFCLAGCHSWDVII